MSTKEALNCLSLKLVSCSFKNMFIYKINIPASLVCRYNVWLIRTLIYIPLHLPKIPMLVFKCINTNHTNVAGIPVPNSCDLSSCLIKRLCLKWHKQPCVPPTLHFLEDWKLELWHLEGKRRNYSPVEKTDCCLFLLLKLSPGSLTSVPM